MDGVFPQHQIPAPQYIVIPETQYLETLRLQPGRARLIAGFQIHVLTAIHFDDQLSFEAHKVDDVFANGLLALELGSTSHPARSCRQSTLRFGGYVAHALGMDKQLLFCLA